MGVIAFVRQAFLDAQHYGVARGARQTVADDPAIEALQPAVDRKMPVAFEANQAREILRALKLAKELELEPIVTGGREADEVAADLKAQNVRVIYSLNYPQRPRALAPDADEPIHTLRHRANAPKVPGELAKAGVAFAFESAGLERSEGLRQERGEGGEGRTGGRDGHSRADDRRRRRWPAWRSLGSIEKARSRISSSPTAISSTSARKI